MMLEEVNVDNFKSNFSCYTRQMKLIEDICVKREIE